jgi:hypothetical protein|tara:strand:+ start:1556 stop:2362 length:807 start_codon:yes stop_codon:yes gene_type:complete
LDVKEASSEGSIRPTLYSQRGISIATVFGAPLAASILIRKNYIELQNKKAGDISLVIGILSTLFIFVGLFFIPENIIDFIPNALIPLIYTGIIYLLIEKYQGKDLKAYEEQGRKFISNWKAFAIGLLTAVLVALPFLGLLYMEANDPVFNEYNTQFDEFIENENIAYRFYENLQLRPTNQLLDELNNVTIPAWENNKIILDSIDQIEGISVNLLARDKLLREYCDLNIDKLKIIKKALITNSDMYDDQIEKLTIEIAQKMKTVEEMDL